MLKVLCLGVLLSLCLFSPLCSTEERRVIKVLPFPTKEERDLATRQAIRRDSRAEPRIYGGKEVSSPNPYPWIAHSLLGCNGLYYSCGTSLLQSNISLIAAQCIMSECDYLSGYVTIGLDRYNSDDRIDFGISVVTHPGYDNETLEDDIALIFFNGRSFDIEKYPHLPSSEVPVGTKVFAAGWGSTSSEYNPEAILHKASLHIQSDSDCSRYYRPDFYPETQLCAGSDRKDACAGDGGGPLFEITDSCWPPNTIVHGIISWGYECWTQYAVYVEVFAYLDWIKETISDENFVNRINFSNDCGEN